MKRAALVICVLAVAIGCGGNNNGETNNGDTNNGMTNNGMTNNGTPNNGMTNNGTPNNGMTNNGMTNNGMTNNGMTNNTNNGNPFGLMGDCAFLEVDQNGDGTFEAAQLQEVDATGNITTRVTDLDRDGTADWISESTWDAEGRELTRRQDGDGDGTFEWKATWEYDANGRMVSLTVDEGEDGTDELIVLQTWDADGNLLTSTRDGAFNMDGTITPADGTLDYTDTRTYHSPTQVATIRVDADGDGDFEFTVDTTVDANGKMTRFEQDGQFDETGITTPANGTADLIQTWDLDANGVSTAFQQDGHFNGTVWVESDGTIDYEERNQVHDANGQLDTFEIDGRRSVFGYIAATADGTFDAADVDLDAEGRLLGFTFDEGGDGSVEVTQTNTFDANGLLLSESRDGMIDNDQNILGAMDGTPDWLVENTWFGPDQPLTHSTDADGDGTADVTGAWEYDANGNLLHASIDGQLDGVEVVAAADGNPDQEYDATYDAMGRVTFEEQKMNAQRTSAAQLSYDSCEALSL